MYRLAKQRNRDGKDVQQLRVIKNRDEHVLTGTKEVIERWKQHFEQLMNIENEREQRVETVTIVDKAVENISKEEVRIAVKRMKSGRAVGPNNIPVEAWKCLGEVAVVFLTRLCNKILESEKMPDEWKEVLWCPCSRTREMHRIVAIIEESN